MEETMIQNIMDSITTPAIIALGALIVIVIKGFTDKISKSIIAKNESETIKQTFSAKSYLIEQISTIVESCVASNMNLANAYKKINYGELTDQQALYLQDNARKLALASLPNNICTPGDNMCKLIGGDDQLNNLIDTLIEKYVYEYKLKQMNNECE